MGNLNNSNSLSNEQFQKTMSEYDIIQEITNENLTFLEHHETHKQFLLRQMSYNDKDQYLQAFTTLQKKKQLLNGCSHITPLVKYMSRTQDQFCSTFYKIYMLFQYPQRTLDDEISERNLQKRRFQQKQLWSILASCILGLSHLQKNLIKHSSLKSNMVLLSGQGVIKVADPYTIGATTNYDTLLNNRSTLHIYLSPQQCKALHEETINPKCHPYKSDIWTLGMILLEAGLLQYQDECYRDDGARIHWQTLQYNVNRFEKNYSQQLTNMLQLMLSKDEKSRPQWTELEEHVMKVQEDVRGSYISQQSTKTIKQKSKMDEKSKNFESLSNSHHFMNEAVYQPLKVVVPSFNEPSLIFKKQQPKLIKNGDINPKSNEYIYSPSIQPINPSNINSTRPLRSVFPRPTYQTFTQIDENLIAVDESDAGSQDTRGYHNLNNNKTMNIREQNPKYHNNSPYKQSLGSLNSNQFKQNEQSNSIWSNGNSTEQGQFTIETFKLGSRYEGYKVRGMRHGKGKFYYQDGGMYDGDWKQNKMQGYGKLFYQSGKIAYDGHWIQDQFTGKGILYNQYSQMLKYAFNYYNFDDVEEFWTKYEGEFFEDRKHGKGILYLSNGQYYEGQFFNDLVEGQGNFYTQDHIRIQGIWKKNQFQIAN